MRLLVVGPESSGTRIMASILSKSEGVEVTHSSPAFRKAVYDRKYYPNEHDAVVLIIRNGSWNIQSMLDREHFRADVYRSPAEQIVDDIYYVTANLKARKPVHIVTYESLVYETEHCLDHLCEALGITRPVGYDEVKNGNEKFWTEDGWEGDNRTLAERQ